MKNITKHLLTFTLVQLNCVQGAMEGFVVGGDETEISKYPHSAFLDAICKDLGHWICGSAILNQRLIITAAHCVAGCDWKNRKENKLNAFVGNADLREVSIKRKVIDVRMHKNYDGQTMENDIAVAIVRNAFPLGPNVKRIIITQEYPTKQDIEIASMILKHVRQNVRSEETCSLIGHLHEGMFCAGNTEKNSDHPARGDSGSALVINLGYHQIGLVSFNIMKYPALMVYTNVSFYFNWIRDNAKSLYCENVIIKDF